MWHSAECVVVGGAPSRSRAAGRRLPTFVLQSPQRLVHARVIVPVIAGRRAVVMPRGAGILLQYAPLLALLREPGQAVFAIRTRMSFMSGWSLWRL